LGLDGALVCFEAFGRGMDGPGWILQKMSLVEDFRVMEVVLAFNAAMVMEHICKNALP
jgi:hypothetical protein